MRGMSNVLSEQEALGGNRYVDFLAGVWTDKANFAGDEPQAAGIRVYLADRPTVQEALAACKAGTLQDADPSRACAHHGHDHDGHGHHGHGPCGS